MDRLILKWLLLAGSILVFSTPYARSASEDRASPPFSKEPVPVPLSYRSIFSGYMSFKDQPVLPWQVANDRAGEIGGWRFYAREGKQPDTDKPIGSKPAETKLPPMPGNSDQRHEHRSKP
jgi:hypothetical protein